MVMLLKRAIILLLVLASAASSATPHQQAFHDTTAPDISQWMPQPAILVFSKTLGWRHNEGIAGADLYFVQLAREKGHGVFTTANGAVFNPEDLARFDLVVFNNVTGDVLSPAQRSAFQDWLRAGGGWIGIHSAGDASQDAWAWYQEELIGPRFIGHPAEPQFQEARIESLSSNHPVTKGIPSGWVHLDEWYSFDSRAQDHGATVLFGLDETTYSPRNDAYGEVSDLRMGAGAINHPIVWVRCVGSGKAFYSAIGHSDESYEDMNNRRLLSNAFDWVTKRDGSTDTSCAEN